ncbi:hypothetical protein D5S18_21670 [Nocardia panacis]|uniref:Secreted protein n=1 Tax=Nocardia panacis TaxID=2340916 RepID=A0A3A4KHA9_9NOCA|nr:zinc metallochaperone AztD [Nocardia panacis]RJO73859.1 hypothetical protein D5S18_21670 [Nocardia panacis]
MRLPSRRVRALGLTLAALALSACGRTEHTAIADPIAITYDGGIYLLDGRNLAVTDRIKLAGFNRVSAAGDDRHIIVSTKDGFRALDAVRAAMTDIAYPAEKPGHVVRHAGRTVLFADGTGEVTIVDPHDLGGTKQTYRTASPHHGVAVRLANGDLVVTLGTDEKRTGVQVLDSARREIARSEDCPGVHGESVVQGETVVIGCENGALIYRAGALTKVAGPTPYSRIGTQAGSDASPIALGDLKQDRDAELERPQQVSLIDTREGRIRTVPLGTSYTFRSLARGPQGEGLVLGTDGRIHVIDPIAGKVVRTIPVIAPWEEPLRWQEPRPALFARGGDLYVTDTAAKKVHRVDLNSGAITATAELPQTPNELSGVVEH